MDKREGGVSRFSVESFMSHSAEKFRRGILLSFINFGYRKVLGIREVEGGGFHVFPSKLLCLTVPKNFVEEQFCVSENFDYGKSFLHEKGISGFWVENFCLIVPKVFVGDPFCVSKKFIRRKFSWIGGGGGHHGFAENFLSHRSVKLRKGVPSVSQNFWYRRKLWIKKRGGGGSIKIFRRKFFVSQCRNIS